jgi:hypothetical protein
MSKNSGSNKIPFEEEKKESFPGDPDKKVTPTPNGPNLTPLDPDSIE